MIHQTDIILPILSLAVPVIGGVIWLIRLEGKVKMNEKLFCMYKKIASEHEKKLDNSLNELYILIGEIQKSVSRIEGRIEK